MPNLYDTLSPNDRKVQEVYAASSRDLVFLQIAASCVSGTLETDYQASGSNFQALIQTLQQAVEIFGIGEPSGNEVTVIVSRSSVPFGEGEEADAGGTVAALESLITANTAVFSGADVFQGQITGWNIENDC